MSVAGLVVKHALMPMRTSATIPEILEAHARARPTALAFIDQADVRTYGELCEHARRVAAKLASLGVEREDRIAYVGRNRLAYFELLFGAALIGAVTVPVSWRLSRTEMVQILEDANARLVFCESAYRREVESAEMGAVQLDRNADLEAWSRGAVPRANGLVKPGDVVVQLYTSGTTGRPKGVMLTHANLLTARVQGEIPNAWDAWVSDDVSLISMPVAHISGTGWMIYGLCAGACGVVLQEFDPKTVLKIIQDRRVSRMFVVPAALRTLAAEAVNWRGSHESLKYIAYGGSPIDPVTLANARAHFRCNFVQLYGLTESSGAVTALTPSDHGSEWPKRLMSAGRALPGVEVKIVTETGQVARPGQSGEIWIRCAGVMAGYFNLRAETQQAVDAQGWLHSGDVGVLDESGYLTVVDRLRDMIISGGENVFAGEVEQVVSNHPAVEEVAVIGIPDARLGERVSAVVVLKAGATLDSMQLTDWSRDKLATYKLPRALITVEALPRNAAGKVLKRVLRECLAPPAANSAEGSSA